MLGLVEGGGGITVYVPTRHHLGEGITRRRMIVEYQYAPRDQWLIDRWFKRDDRRVHVLTFG